MAYIGLTVALHLCCQFLSVCWSVMAVNAAQTARPIKMPFEEGQSNLDPITTVTVMRVGIDGRYLANMIEQSDLGGDAYCHYYYSRNFRNLLMLKLHLIDSLSICCTSKFATNTVKNRTDGA